jgi:hypothetical protein
VGLAGLVASSRTRCVNASYTRFVAKSTVVMWMDFGCPWSRISLHELERAIAVVGEPVDVRFHSLRLDADAPADYGKTTIENLCEHLSIDVVEAERMLQVVRGEFTAHFENGEIIGEYVCIHVRNCGQHFRMPDCQSQPLG